MLKYLIIENDGQKMRQQPFSNRSPDWCATSTINWITCYLSTIEKIWNLWSADYPTNHKGISYFNNSKKNFFAINKQNNNI